MIRWAVSDRELHLAWQRVAANAGGAGADGEDLEEFATCLAGEVDRLASDLTTGRYAPYALFVVPVPRADGGTRVLAYPTVRDRVAQTAFLLRLEPVLEAEFEECSFGYRHGRSVRDAIHVIRTLRDDGYVWVVDADVDQFFDSISHARLFARLAKLPVTPAERALLGLWVTAPRWDGKRLRQPRAGLPQGAVVSPGLANLVLDEMDEKLLARNLKLVRYADDFVILCRTQPEATAALKLTEDVLTRLGLALDGEKTAITDFERGFRFLGAIFMRSLIVVPFDVDRRRTRAHAVRRPRTLPEDQWQAWLARCGRTWLSRVLRQLAWPMEE
jgi:group II intron reverse transcriptase/maturase